MGRVAVFEAEARRAQPDAIFTGRRAGAVGCSGVCLAGGLRDALGVRRDIVLVDVRGTGGSDALRCGSDASIAAMLRLSPDTKRLQRCAEKYAERLFTPPRTWPTIWISFARPLVTSGSIS